MTVRIVWNTKNDTHAWLVKDELGGVLAEGKITEPTHYVAIDRFMKLLHDIKRWPPRTHGEL